jgi:N-myristoyl transferase
MKYCVSVFQFFLRFDLAPIFSEEEFKHWFLPRDGIVYTFVVENDGEITGNHNFPKNCVFFSLKSKIESFLLF